MYFNGKGSPVAVSKHADALARVAYRRTSEEVGHVNQIFTALCIRIGDEFVVNKRKSEYIGQHYYDRLGTGFVANNIGIVVVDLLDSADWCSFVNCTLQWQSDAGMEKELCWLAMWEQEGLRNQSRIPYPNAVLTARQRILIYGRCSHITVRSKVGRVQHCI